MDKSITLSKNILKNYIVVLGGIEMIFSLGLNHFCIRLLKNIVIIIFTSHIVLL